MGKVVTDSIGVVVTDSDFNIKYINSSASAYIREDNLKTTFGGHPVLPTLLEKKNFVDKRVRIFRSGMYYDLYCTAEYGKEFCFIFNGIEISEVKYSFCRDELSEFVGELKCFTSVIESGVNLMMNESGKSDDAVLKNIKANVGQLSIAMANCIGLANAENGGISPKKEMLDLVMLIKMLVRGILAYFNDDRIHINFRGREELVLFADFDMLRRAIINILSSSLSYITGACEIDIDISVSNNNAVLRIINHFGGKYIDVVNDVFDTTVACCRAKKPIPDINKVSYKYAEKCVELNGGTISFDTIHDGACFIIEIPIETNTETLCSEPVHLELNYDSELFHIREKRNGEKDA